ILIAKSLERVLIDLEESSYEIKEGKKIRVPLGGEISKRIHVLLSGMDTDNRPEKEGKETEAGAYYRKLGFVRYFSDESILVDDILDEDPWFLISKDRARTLIDKVRELADKSGKIDKDAPSDSRRPPEGSLLEGYKTLLEEFRNKTFTREEFRGKRTKSTGKLFSYTTVRSELDGLVVLDILDVNVSERPYKHRLSAIFKRGPPAFIREIKLLLKTLPARPTLHELLGAKKDIDKIVVKYGIEELEKIDLSNSDLKYVEYIIELISTLDEIVDRNNVARLVNKLMEILDDPRTAKMRRGDVITSATRIALVTILSRNVAEKRARDIHKKLYKGLSQKAKKFHDKYKVYVFANLTDDNLTILERGFEEVPKHIRGHIGVKMITDENYQPAGFSEEEEASYLQDAHTIIFKKDWFDEGKDKILSTLRYELFHGISGAYLARKELKLLREYLGLGRWKLKKNGRLIDPDTLSDEELREAFLYAEKNSRVYGRWVSKLPETGYAAKEGMSEPQEDLSELYEAWKENSNDFKARVKKYKNLRRKVEWLEKIFRAPSTSGVKVRREQTLEDIGIRQYEIDGVLFSAAKALTSKEISESFVPLMQVLKREIGGEGYVEAIFFAISQTPDPKQQADKLVNTRAASSFFELIHVLEEAGVLKEDIITILYPLVRTPDPKRTAESIVSFIQILQAELIADKNFINHMLEELNLKVSIRAHEPASIGAAKGLIAAMGLDKNKAVIGYDGEVTESLAKRQLEGYQVEAFPPTSDQEHRYAYIEFHDAGKILRLSTEGDCHSIPYGSFKYKGLPERISKKKITQIKDELNIGKRKVIVVGSPSEGELETIISSYNDLYGHLPVKRRPLLIIAAREKMMIRQLRLLNSSGQKMNFRKDATLPFDDMSEDNVLILDTSGELATLYAVGDVSIVGNDRNILEPANQGKAVLYCNGLWLKNDEAKEDLREEGAALEFNQKNLKALMEDAARSASMGKKGLSVVNDFNTKRAPKGARDFIAALLPTILLTEIERIKSGEMISRHDRVNKLFRKSGLAGIIMLFATGIGNAAEMAAPAVSFGLPVWAIAGVALIIALEKLFNVRRLITPEGIDPDITYFSAESAPTGGGEDSEQPDAQRLPTQKDFEEELIWLIPQDKKGARPLPRTRENKEALINRYQKQFNNLLSLKIRLNNLRAFPKVLKAPDPLNNWEKLTGTNEGELGIPENKVRQCSNLLYLDFERKILPTWEKLTGTKEGELGIPENKVRQNPSLLTNDFERNILSTWRKLTGTKERELGISEDKVRQNPNLLTNDFERNILPTWKKLTGTKKGELGIPEDKVRQYPVLLSLSFEGNILPKWEKLTSTGEGELGIPENKVRQHPNLLYLDFEGNILPKWEKLTGTREGELGIPEDKVRKYPNLLTNDFERNILPTWKKLTGTKEGELGIPENKARKFPNLLYLDFEGNILPTWEKLTGTTEGELGIPENKVRQRPNLLYLDFEGNILPTWEKLTGTKEGELGIPENKVRQYPNLLYLDFEGNIFPTWEKLTGTKEGELGIPENKVRQYPQLFTLDFEGNIFPTYYYLVNVSSMPTEVVRGSSGILLQRSLNNTTRPRTIFSILNGLEVNSAVVGETPSKFIERLHRAGLSGTRYDAFLEEHRRKERIFNEIEANVKKRIPKSNTQIRKSLKVDMVWLRIYYDEHRIAQARGLPEEAQRLSGEIDRLADKIINYLPQESGEREEIKRQIINETRRGFTETGIILTPYVLAIAAAYIVFTLVITVPLSIAIPSLITAFSLAKIILHIFDIREDILEKLENLFRIRKVVTPEGLTFPMLGISNFADESAPTGGGEDSEQPDAQRLPTQEDFEEELIWLIPQDKRGPRPLPRTERNKKALINRYQDQFNVLHKTIKIKLKDLRRSPELFKLPDLLDRWQGLTGAGEGQLGISKDKIRGYPRLLTFPFERNILPKWKKLTGTREGQLGISRGKIKQYLNLLTLDFEKNILPKWEKLTGTGAGQLGIPAGKLRQHPNLLTYDFERKILPTWEELTGTKEGQLGIPRDKVRQYPNLLTRDFKRNIIPGWEKLTGAEEGQLGILPQKLRQHPNLLAYDFEKNILPTWEKLTGAEEGQLGISRDKIRQHPDLLTLDFEGNLFPKYYYLTNVSAIPAEVVEGSLGTLLRTSLNNKIRPRTLFLLLNGIERVNSSAMTETRAEFIDRLLKKGLDRTQYNVFLEEYERREEIFNDIEDIISGKIPKSNAQTRKSLKADMVWLRIYHDEYRIAQRHRLKEDIQRLSGIISRQIDKIMNYLPQDSQEREDIRRKFNEAGLGDAGDSLSGKYVRKNNPTGEHFKALAIKSDRPEYMSQRDWDAAGGLEDIDAAREEDSYEDLDSIGGVYFKIDKKFCGDDREDDLLVWEHDIQLVMNVLHNDGHMTHAPPGLKIKILSLSRSPHLGEDCKSNSLIGINHTVTNRALRRIILYHEMLHEIYPEDEYPLMNEEKIYSLTLDFISTISGIDAYRLSEILKETITVKRRGDPQNILKSLEVMANEPARGQAFPKVYSKERDKISEKEFRRIAESTYLYKNPRDPELFSKIDRSGLSKKLKEQIEFDENEANYYWDEEIRYWRSKHFRHLVLGTYEDIQGDNESDHPDVKMKRHVAIRTKAGFTIYACDNHQYSYGYIKEAQARGEISRPKDKTGHIQIFVDRHNDGGSPQPTGKWAGIKGIPLGKCQSYIDDVLNMGTFNIPLFEDGTIKEHWQVEGPLSPEELDDLWTDQYAFDFGEDLIEVLLSDGTKMYYPAEGEKPPFAPAVEGLKNNMGRWHFWYEYFKNNRRPIDTDAIVNCDTDATLFGEEYSEALYNLKKDNVAPSIFLISTSFEEKEGSVKKFGSVSMAQRLAKDAILLFAAKKPHKTFPVITDYDHHQEVIDEPLSRAAKEEDLELIEASELFTNPMFDRMLSLFKKAGLDNLSEVLITLCDGMRVQRFRPDEREWILKDKEGNEHRINGHASDARITIRAGLSEIEEAAVLAHELLDWFNVKEKKKKGRHLGPAFEEAVKKALTRNMIDPLRPFVKYLKALNTTKRPGELLNKALDNRHYTAEGSRTRPGFFPGLKTWLFFAMATFVGSTAFAARHGTDIIQAAVGSWEWVWCGVVFVLGVICPGYKIFLGSKSNRAKKNLPAEKNNRIRQYLSEQPGLFRDTIESITDEELTAIIRIAESTDSLSQAKKIVKREVLTGHGLNEKQIKAILKKIREGHGLVKSIKEDTKRHAKIEINWLKFAYFIIAVFSGVILYNRIQKLLPLNVSKDVPANVSDAAEPFYRIVPIIATSKVDDVDVGPAAGAKRKVSFYFGPHLTKEDAEEYLPILRNDIKKAKKQGYNPVVIMESAAIARPDYNFSAFVEKHKLLSRSREEFHAVMKEYIRITSKRKDMVWWYEGIMMDKIRTAVSLSRGTYKPFRAGGNRRYADYMNAHFELFSSSKVKLVFEDAGLENAIRLMVVLELDRLAQQRLNRHGDIEGYIRITDESLRMMADSSAWREQAIKMQIEKILEYKTTPKPCIFVRIGGNHASMQDDYERDKYNINVWTSPRLKTTLPFVGRTKPSKDVELPEKLRRKRIQEELVWFILRDYFISTRNISPKTTYDLFDPVLSRMTPEKIEKMIQEMFSKAQKRSGGLKPNHPDFARGLIAWLSENELTEGEKRDLKKMTTGIQPSYLVQHLEQGNPNWLLRVLLSPIVFPHELGNLLQAAVSGRWRDLEFSLRDLFSGLRYKDRAPPCIGGTLANLIIGVISFFSANPVLYIFGTAHLVHAGIEFLSVINRFFLKAHPSQVDKKFPALLFGAPIWGSMQPVTPEGFTFSMSNGADPGDEPAPTGGEKDAFNSILDFLDKWDPRQPGRKMELYWRGNFTAEDYKDFLQRLSSRPEIEKELEKTRVHKLLLNILVSDSAIDQPRALKPLADLLLLDVDDDVGYRAKIGHAQEFRRYYDQDGKVTARMRLVLNIIKRDVEAIGADTTYIDMFLQNLKILAKPHGDGGTYIIAAEKPLKMRSMTTKQKILSATKRLIERGERPTVNNIAKEAAVAIATVVRYRKDYPGIKKRAEKVLLSADEKILNAVKSLKKRGEVPTTRETIAKEAGLNEATVRRHMRANPDIEKAVEKILIVPVSTGQKILNAIKRLKKRDEVPTTLEIIAKEAGFIEATIISHMKSNPDIEKAVEKILIVSVPTDQKILNAIKRLKKRDEVPTTLEIIAKKAGLAINTVRDHMRANPDIEKAVEKILIVPVSTDEKILNAIKSLKERDEVPTTIIIIAEETGVSENTVRNHMRANPDIEKAVEEILIVPVSAEQKILNAIKRLKERGEVPTTLEIIGKEVGLDESSIRRHMKDNPVVKKAVEAILSLSIHQRILNAIERLMKKGKRPTVKSIVKEAGASKATVVRYKKVYSEIKRAMENPSSLLPRDKEVFVSIQNVKNKKYLIHLVEDKDTPHAENVYFYEVYLLNIYVGRLEYVVDKNTYKNIHIYIHGQHRDNGAYKTVINWLIKKAKEEGKSIEIFTRNPEIVDIFFEYDLFEGGRVYVGDKVKTKRNKFEWKTEKELTSNLDEVYSDVGNLNVSDENGDKIGEILLSRDMQATHSTVPAIGEYEYIKIGGNDEVINMDKNNKVVGRITQFQKWLKVVYEPRPSRKGKSSKSGKRRRDKRAGSATGDGSVLEGYRTL
ncbi:hypothetical protein ACFL5Y_02895, partial [Candidatus Omnitrophota bacterium]